MEAQTLGVVRYKKNEVKYYHRPIGPPKTKSRDEERKGKQANRLTDETKGGDGL